MTGTNCDLFTYDQSRSYLNHLVYTYIFCVLFVYLSVMFCSYSSFVVLCICIFVCTSEGLLPPGEIQITVSK
jgi:hypothetical protein